MFTGLLVMLVDDCDAAPQYPILSRTTNEYAVNIEDLVVERTNQSTDIFKQCLGGALAGKTQI